MSKGKEEERDRGREERERDIQENTFLIHPAIREVSWEQFSPSCPPTTSSFPKLSRSLDPSLGHFLRS